MNNSEALANVGKLTEIELITVNFPTFASASDLFIILPPQD